MKLIRRRRDGRGHRVGRGNTVDMVNMLDAGVSMLEGMRVVAYGMERLTDMEWVVGHSVWFGTGRVQFVWLRYHRPLI